MNVHATDSTIDHLAKLRSMVNNLERWRPEIEHILHRYSHMTHSFNDLVELTLSNRLLFFSIDEAFAFMQKVVHPQYAELHCFLAGGDLAALEQRTDYMRDIAANLDCRYLTIAGRIGFRRYLEGKGWEYDATIMRTPVGER